MKYPSKTKEQYTTNITYANRGMGLEKMINASNLYYLETNKAIIYKKPTDIGINKVQYKPKLIIKDAYFKSPSTLDYNGIYKGKYIEFDAKETKNKTAYPLSNIMLHQIIHIEKIIQHGGICFLIIQMNNQIYLLPGNYLIEFYKNQERKSIPFKYIQDKSYLIKFGFNPMIDYLKVIDKLI